MFTGIVEEVGEVIDLENGLVSIKASQVLSGTKIGDSISVSGCCLTVVGIGDYWFSAQIVEETFSRTTFSQLHLGSKLNLERSMAANGRFSGHIVQGHIDGVGKVLGQGTRLTVEFPPGCSGYIVEKGSIAIDGVSLTVAEKADTSLTVALVPHTLESTTLGQLSKGDGVNIEVDLLAKYIETLLISKTP